MKRILIVDDEELIRSILRRLLEKLPLDIEEAEDGEQGAALFARETFDLIIADYRMPKVDGMAMIRQCRRQFPEHPCIVISGEYPAGIAQMEKVFYLPKPFDSAVLVNLVGDLLHLDSSDLPRMRPYRRVIGFPNPSDHEAHGDRTYPTSPYACSPV